MSDMRFSGLPAGQASLSVQQAGQQSTLSTTLTNPPLVGERNCFVVERAPVADNWTGMTVTTKDVDGQRIAWGMAPPVYREVAQVSTGDANRLISSGFNDKTITPETYIGGTADVYRISNGEIDRIRQSTITGGNWSSWHEEKVVTDTLYNFRFRNWNAFGERFWFGVAAIDGDNAAGAIAEAHYDLPTDARNAPAVDNPFVTNLNWSEGGTLPAPTGFTVTPSADHTGNIALTWDAVPGASAYVVFVGYADPSTFEATQYLTLEDDGGPALKTGDMVILTNRIMSPRITMKSRRVYNDGPTNAPFNVTALQNTMNLPDGDLTYEYGDWTEADPAPDPSLGTSYARVNVKAGSGPTDIMRRFWSGSAAQTFYPVPRTDQMFRFRAWIEVDRAVVMKFEYGLEGVPDAVFTLTPGWHEVVLDGSAASFRADGPGIYRWRLSVQDRAEPVQLRIAGVRYHDVSNEYHTLAPNLAELVPEGMFLRDHSLIKPGQRTTDVAALTNPPGESQQATTLEGFMRACKATKALPWIQIEWYHTVEDWLDILAYLAAPVSSGHPMALKRQSNGRTAPWVDAFDQIRWEFGNESWNSLAAFWNPPANMPDDATGETWGRGHIFGFMCRRAALAMQASPFWTDKIRFVLGGRARNTYSFHIADGFRLPAEVGIANYNGGWDEGNTIVSENEASYQATVGVVPAHTSQAIDFLVEGLEALTQEPGFPLEYGTELRPTCYEAGPGYQLNGLNGAAVTEEEVITQEVVMKSRAAGTGTLETMLYQAQKGFAAFNFFTLSDGDDWSARASAAQGGGVYSSFALCRVVLEQMGASSIYRSNALRPDTFEVYDRSDELVTPPSGFVYGLRSHANPRRFMLAIGNRSVHDSLPLSIFSTIKSCDALTAWANVGDYREHNRYPVGQRLVAGGGYTPDPLCVDMRFDPIVLPVPTDPARIDIDASLGLPGLENGLPPGNALLLQLDGVVFRGS